MKRIPWDDPLEEIHAQKMAVALLEYACDGSRGRKHIGDAVYDAVTEKRQRAGYSSCADLAHWLLYRLGVRHRLVNRAEHAGWTSGVNVSRLAYSEFAQSVRPTARFAPGDIVIVWNRNDTTDAHVACVIDEVTGERLLMTADYGQPGGRLKTQALTERDGGLFLGGKRIQRHIPLLAVLRSQQAAGALEDITDPRPEPET